MLLRPLSFGVGVIVAVATASASSAAVLRVDETAFVAGSGLITFDEPGYPLGTLNPTYTPSDYGGGPGSPTVTTGGFFNGQDLSSTPAIDCPGAAPTACLIGSPDGPLSLDPQAPTTEIVTDTAFPTSPTLSGTPTFDGPIALHFDSDQVGVGFEGGFFDAVESTGITAYARDGSNLGTVSNQNEGIEFLGLVAANGEPQIAGVALDLVGEEPAGFNIDNVRFGRRENLDVPDLPNPDGVPMPGATALLGAGLVGLGAVSRRRGKRTEA